MALVLLATGALAQVPSRSFFSLPSSNGHGAVLADTKRGALTHFREQLPATEEPLLDDQGHEVWLGNQPQMVASRDLLFDAYFGVRVGAQHRWLDGLEPTDSHYDGASGIVTWSQSYAGLRWDTFVFSPRTLPHASYVMVTCATATSAQQDVHVFALTNLHLGFGRPGVRTDLGANGETVVIEGSDVSERGFAGVVVVRPLGAATPTAWNPSTPAGENGFLLVRDGSADLPARSGDLGVADDWATALQFDLGAIPANTTRCAGLVAAHHADPFASATVRQWLDAWVGARDAQAVLSDERASWRQFTDALRLPAALDGGTALLARQAGVFLSMAQVQDDRAFLREWLTRDGEPRHTRFTLLDGGTTLPGVIHHRGAGAVLASLPPGEWTYSWVRDGSYAAVAMAELGLNDASARALSFFLDAEGGRFQGWNELQPGFPAYVVSLTRYVGFGVEETDFNDFGPNLEFDGFGLVLWALRERELRTGDTTLVDARWDLIATRIAEPLVALIEPSTGLLRKDSSIWETHWNGRQRAWAYSNITAARGLCDAAELARRRGDMNRAMTFRTAGLTLRSAIARTLTDDAGALASNREELVAGEGYFDAAVFDAIAMGLFDPRGRIATATLDAMERSLRVQFGPGWARNDDRTDHAGRDDLSPWGSEYDSAEWVVTDLRGAMALRAAERTRRADEVLEFTTAQAMTNANVFVETYDERTGVWKFNAPMIGFGAGAWLLAQAQVSGRAVEPACGAYLDESTPDAGLPVFDAGPPQGDAGVPTTDAGVVVPPAPQGCGCGAAPVSAALLALLVLRRSGARARRA